VEQRDIPYDTPSFSVALNEVLRQNADVVVVGEIVEPQTLRATLRIADSGILTMATFHTPTAVETLNRLLNFFPGEEVQIQRQLSLVLRGIFSQQLIPLFQKNGLIPAWEVLLVNGRVATLLRDGNIHQINNVIETGSKMGMQSMAQNLISLYERKLISKRDLLLRIKDREREELKKLVSEEGSAEDNPL
jgi:twitching motility protein PilT